MRMRWQAFAACTPTFVMAQLISDKDLGEVDVFPARRVEGYLERLCVCKQEVSFGLPGR